MEIFGFFSILISISAIFAYFNHRYLRLPTAIGLMVLGLLMSVIILIINIFIPTVEQKVEVVLREIDFSAFLLDTILCFLLFAGSLHVKLPMLFSLKKQIASYATLGVLISTFLIGGLIYYIFPLFGLQVSFITCLLFGALISPTDPIAVLGILTKANVPKKVETEIVGESLFNDGTGVVAFLTILQIIQSKGQEIQTSQIALLILEEVGGGLLLGFALGYIGYWLLKSIDHYQTEVLITLALVMGGYSLAQEIHFSGPLAMVVAGLFIGNKGRMSAMSDVTEEYVDKFWELIDEILNALLFVLIGLEFLLIPFEISYVVAGLAAVFVVLFARVVAVGIPLYIFNPKEKNNGKTLILLTWGGLRGGISVALALLAYNKVPEGSFLIVATYVVVLFSIIFQGLTIERLIKKLNI
ncbi:cation:proton antiporter [Thermoflexibacter ruber]|uniref:Sodium/proton antiporter, CPA1 family n=1 Tax=Thermoflexibacter ruber TaxID=1003 RepID=A0A1I2DL58_9BACT|nr:sodium:proton antiporter [Thermoflexibacter ruber]SFE81011.1 sodium/proton antiporter, CPA1 family [Thermoflexibacter ruber]